MEIPVVKTQGIILRKTELNDTDRFLTVYTEKFGKILIRAKGVGKKESKLKSFLEPFNIYEFLLARSKNTDVLANSYSLKEFLNLRQNLESLSLAFYFAELVDKLVTEPEQDENIWALLVKALGALDKFNSPQPSLTLREGEKLKNFTPLKVRGAGGVMITLDNLKAVFEEKLLEYLGHPNFKVSGKVSAREKQNYLALLAGEEIKSVSFLSSLSLIS